MPTSPPPSSPGHGGSNASSNTFCETATPMAAAAPTASSAANVPSAPHSTSTAPRSGRRVAPSVRSTALS
ncbi:hypothetical protein G6F24_016390 [Rhizopus arrhizus]|nr:hypothetical protein G6F24_016390 [Rhizopus arrhizus]